MVKNLVKGGFFRCWGDEVLKSKFSGSRKPSPYLLNRENLGSFILVFAASHWLVRYLQSWS